MTDEGLSRSERGSAALALFLARVVYAINWYNIGAVLPLIGGSFGIGTARLGIVLGAFLAGVGIFQVPAGFAAIRFGARSVSLVGLAGMAICCILSGWSPNFEALAVLRFGAGVGAAFFFSPGLSLIASYFPPGHRGPVIGLYNGGFSIGGAVGLFAGAVLGQAIGWPLSLTLAGLALLLTVGAAELVLPAEPERAGPRTIAELWSAGRAVVRSRSVWALALSMTGFWAAIYDVAQYWVKYAFDVHPDWGVGVAAALAALVVVISFPGGPFGGWIAERGFDRRYLMACFAVVACGMVLLIPLASLLTVWGILGLLGFVDGVVFAILYLIPTYLPETQGNGLALGVGVVNSIQVLLGGGLAVAFGVIAGALGFTAAWWFAGVVGLATVPAALLVVPNRARESVVVAVRRPSAEGP